MANWWESAPLATKEPPKDAGGSWWEAAPLANAPKEEPSVGETIARKLGVGTRAVAQGLAQVPGLIYDVAALPFNAGFAGYNALTGDKLPQIAPARQQVSQALDLTGLPKPDTAGERIVSAINEGGAGMLPTIGLGAAANLPQLSSQAASQVASGMGSGAGSQVAKEMGFGPLAQFGAGVAGGIATPLATSAVAGVLSPRVRGGAQELVDKGVYPSYGQLRGGNAEASENLAARLPFVGPQIKEADRRTLQQYAARGFDEALGDIGRVAPGSTGNQASAKSADLMRNAYNETLSRFNVTGEQIANSLLPKVRVAAKTVGPEDAEAFSQTVTSLVRSGDGKTLNTARRQLENLAYDTDKETLRTAYKAVADGITQLMKSSNPQAAQALDRLDEIWPKFLAAQRAAATETAKGNFNPQQLAQAAKAVDLTPGRQAASQGRAPMQDYAQLGIEVMGKNAIARGEPQLGLSALFQHPIMSTGALLRQYPLQMYSPGGQEFWAKALTQRPDYARALADALRYPSAGQIGLGAIEGTAR